MTVKNNLLKPLLEELRCVIRIEIASNEIIKSVGCRRKVSFGVGVVDFQKRVFGREPKNISDCIKRISSGRPDSGVRIANLALDMNLKLELSFVSTLNNSRQLASLF